jgi:hypothetical protein
MKNTFKIALLSATMFVASQSLVHAQEKKPVGKQIGTAAKDVGHATSTAAKDVGKKTSELASKGAAAVVDKKYAGKAGPNGEIIYINEHAKYYYVNKKGHRVYVTEAQLHTKPNN